MQVLNSVKKNITELDARAEALGLYLVETRWSSWRLVDGGGGQFTPDFATAEDAKPILDALEYARNTYAMKRALVSNTTAIGEAVIEALRGSKATVLLQHEGIKWGVMANLGRTTEIRQGSGHSLLKAMEEAGLIKTPEVMGE